MGVEAWQWNVPALIFLMIFAPFWCDSDCLVMDWLCTILSMISFFELFIGIIFSRLDYCIFAAVWMVAYTVVWLFERECQKPTQLAWAILIVLFEAGAIGYLLH